MSIWRVMARPLATTVALTSIASAPVSAQDGLGALRWKVAPSLAATSLTGEAAIGQVRVDAGSSDIFSNLDVAFMAYVEAMRGEWGVGLDIIYGEFTAPLADPSGELTVTQGTYTATVIRPVTSSTNAYAGARWNSLSATIVLGGTAGDTRQEKDWVDPVLGASVDHPIGERWRLGVVGDVGGFGLGSRFSGQLWPNVFMDIATNGRLGLGYRLLYVNYSDDAGARYFEYNVLTHGPTFGFVFLL